MDARGEILRLLATAFANRGDAMRRFLAPLIAGICCATCWTIWTGAVAAKNPILTIVSEFGLLGVNWFTWGWYVERQYEQWWCYAVASAVASGVVVALS